MAPKKAEDAKKRRSFPPSNAKRPRTEESNAAKSPAKLAKGSGGSKGLLTIDECLKCVEEAIEKLEDISEPGREMLRLMVRGSLGVPAGDRHRFQASAAKMVQEAVQSVEDAISRDVAASKEGMDSRRGIVQAKSQELRGAKEAFSDRLTSLRAARAAVLADNQKLQKHRREVEAAKTERLACEAKLKSVIGCKDELQNALDLHLPAIISGSGTTKHHVDAVEQLLGQVELEESLRGGASSSIKLAPEARGFFDKTVLDLLVTEVRKLLDAVPAAEEEHAAVDAAKKVEADAVAGFAEARKQQASSARALREAELCLRESEGAEGNVAESLQEAEEAVSCAEQHHLAAEKHLEEFHDGPMAALDLLLSPPAEAMETETGSAAVSPRKLEASFAAGNC
eukprot:TRINITY_DN27748_c0_g1_i2.p1 TRINITY_DN27748_c0_g1~~TRINITY_DN27748_c0_g1_i2.p1  ORF type:complete len:397 (-),score=119.74 TRINITY_DN27748_c0_g1_i2:41-1231(-)